uniref:ORF7 n=1 Tax=Lymantria dispar multicapsid nuclear polyhedrosis virus TaxID=10449 RepID=A0A513WW48_NPVLD|nr:ORF7 [Lymantria dispar multiple nucleopolyhedrovirus]
MSEPDGRRGAADGAARRLIARTNGLIVGLSRAGRGAGSMVR